MIVMQAYRLMKSLEMSAAYYAVARGHQHYIYNIWGERKAQIHQYSGVVYKKLLSREAAQNFIRQKTSCPSKRVKSSKKKIKNTQDLDNIALSLRKSPLPAIDRLVKEKSTEKKCEQIDTSEISSPISNEQPSSSKFITDDNGYVIVYTDGACRSNGRRNAQAGLGVWFGEDHPLNVSERVVGRITNINAEIQAVTMAAKKAKEVGVEKLKIITDSKFLIQCITEWMPKWKKNGWKTVSDNPVTNKDELIEMEKALSSLKIAWEHVNGHSGIHGNVMADKLAKADGTS
ncbi:ribonuclease H1-like isoform X2 [Megalopta genalis]|uniref:ribonuclease H1-like isoform X2 n=1 Tax=Megalopta genalis TaxID=115081 RepID=UPI003FD59A68